MRAVLVSDYRHARCAPIGDHAPLVVGLVEEGIHAFEHALANAGRLSEPDRRAEKEDVCIKDFLAEARPSVSPALV
jgi:hypothetical protein